MLNQPATGLGPPSVPRRLATADRHRLHRGRLLRWAVRVVGAVLLGAIAALHLHLWLDGYRSIPTIGPLFLLNVIGVGLLALVVLAAPEKLMAWLQALGSLAAAGTLAALVVSLTAGLFGWQESLDAPWVMQTVVVESVAVVVMAAGAALAWSDRGRLGDLRRRVRRSS